MLLRQRAAEEGLELEVLAKDKDQHVRREVADNPNTPVALLEALVKGKGDVLKKAAQNPSVPLTMLHRMAKAGRAAVRAAAASNPRLVQELRESVD